MGTYTSNSTVFAASISTFLRSVTSQLATTDTRIATTKRVNSMRDDPVAYIMSDRLNRDANILRGIVHDDLERGIGIFTQASSTIGEIRTLFSEMEDLAADAASGSPSLPRAELDAQFQAVKTQITNKINAATYNGVDIFDGTYDSANGGTDLQLMYTKDLSNRASLRVDKTTLATLGLDSLDLTNQANAQAAYDSLTDNQTAGTALTNLNTLDAKISRNLSFAQNHHDYAEVQATNYESAAVNMTEADTVWEIARQTSLQIQQQAAISVLAQGNVRASYVLNLFPNLSNWG